MKKIISLLICFSFILAWTVPVLSSDNTPNAKNTISDQPDTRAAQPLSKEEQEMQDITTDTGTGTGYKQLSELPPALTDDQKEALKKAEKFFREGVISYRKGDTKASKRYYNAFTATLNAANLDSDINYFLSEDYDRIFMKLNKLMNATGNEKRYAIPIDPDNELVKKFVEIYSKGEARERVTRAMERSGKYRDIILGVLKEYGLPPELFYLPVVESLYSNNDLSSAGALGIWQIMPQRARALNLKINYWIDERKDPEKATRAAAEYLRDLFLMFDDWHLALAAYNRGEYGLARDLKFSQATNINQMADRKAVPRETEKYVPQFIAATIVGENYKNYGMNPQFEKPVECDRVCINNVIDLKIVAECAGTTVENIRDLNPAIMAWCTPQNYPNFELKLPRGTKDSFIDNLSKVKDLNPSRGFIKYKVAKGDWLEKIATKFNASITTIKEDNKLKGKKYLRIGQVLIIRPGKKYFAKHG